MAEVLYRSKQWRDARSNQPHPSFPDFRQKIIKEALWSDSWNTPQRIRQGLQRPSSFGIDCRSRECRSENAVEVSTPQQDPDSWAARILIHTKSGHIRQALKVYGEMTEHKVKPNSYTFVALLKACNTLQDLRYVKHIHAEVVRYGLEADVYVGTVLVDVYGKWGSLVDARSVFEKLRNRNVVSWTAMIVGYTQGERGDLALQLYARMQQEGVLPNDRTFVGALKACVSLVAQKKGTKGDGSFLTSQCLEQVRAIHLNVVKRGFESDVYVATMLVDAYAKYGCLVDARTVFDKMSHRNVVSWTAMILGYAQMEQGEEALRLYSRMHKEGVTPNDRTYVSALKACSGLAASESRNTGDSKQVRRRCLDQVRAIHSAVVQCGSATSIFVSSMLVDGYAKCGNLVDARRVFDSMLHRNVVSWNAMILGYAQMEEGEEALHLFVEMRQSGVVPDEVTFVGALKACSSVVRLDKGKEIHLQIKAAGLDITDSLLASCLIDMYGKCGSMDDAQQVFESLSSTHITTWNALMAGYARQGETEPVFSLLERMTQEGLVPNSITFLSVLSACSHVGIVDKGKTYFQAMTRDFGITPSIEHYTCMVDLLGRAGEVENAMAMARAMHFQPDAAVWEILLGACRKWGKVEIGRQAFECALRLDRSNAAAYVVMSNIYADAHMWDDVKNIQDMRANSGAWKQPGQSSWTDMAGRVHLCVVGNRDSPERHDVYENLRIRLSDEGL